MLILVAVTFAFVFFRDLNRDELATPTRSVDYEQAANFAREQLDLDVLVPTPLPEGWRVTSVSFKPSPESWHLGMLTDQEKYVGLEQAASSAEKMVETHVDRDAARGGQIRIDGQSWTVWTDDGGDTALVRSEGETTTLVVGTAGEDVLVDFVTSLG